jgi:hypothetical protein
MDLDQRKQVFIERLRPYLESGKYTREMLNEFYQYWVEHSENGKKMRFEKEKVFGLERRLITWYNNSLKWNKNNDTKQINNIAEAIRLSRGGN